MTAGRIWSVVSEYQPSALAVSVRRSGRVTITARPTVRSEVSASQPASNPKSEMKALALIVEHAEQTATPPETAASTPAVEE